MKMATTVLISCIISISLTHVMNQRALNLLKRDLLKDSDDTFFAQRTMLMNAIDDHNWDIDALKSADIEFNTRLSILAKETDKNSEDITELIQVVSEMRKRKRR